jgi:hypothetical protein
MPSCADSIVVRGRISDDVDEGQIHYIAAAPVQRGSSFSGSGLPYADVQQAFASTPNRGTVKLSSGNAYEFTVVAPSSFYRDLCGTIVPPTVYVSYTSRGENKVVPVKIGNGVPFRTLTYDRRRTSPTFYANDRLTVRSQDALIRDSAYPPCEDASMPDNFWGTSVPTA